ncbi:uncharacterized protein ACIB01_013467 isoform 2-T3 [Guaruba guarouba]
MYIRAPIPKRKPPTHKMAVGVVCVSLEVLQDDRRETLPIAPAEITDLLFTCKSEFKIQGYQRLHWPRKKELQCLARQNSDTSHPRHIHVNGQIEFRCMRLFSYSAHEDSNTTVVGSCQPL